MRIKKNIIASAFFMMLILFALGCKSDGLKYVSSEKIEINFWGDVTEDAWLKIDDLVIYHIPNDTTAGCNGEEFDFFTLNNPEEDVDTLFLPTRKIYDCLGDKWAPRDQTNGVMATNLLIAINNGGTKLQEDGFKMENKYEYEGNMYLVSQGKLTIKRVDGKKIKVSSSEGYGASIAALKE